MRNTMWSTFILVALGCETNGASNADLQELRTAVGRLEQQNESLQKQLTEAKSTLAALQTSHEDLESLLDGVSRTEDGDLLFQGMNVRIDSGASSSASNGKGNLVIGENGPRMQGTCAGGPNVGLSCAQDSNCADSTCDNIIDVADRSGSHNLVIGDGSSYSGNGNVVIGYQHTVTGHQNFVLGASNIAEGNDGVVFGENNTVSGDVSGILGGLNNTTSGAYAVVVGGTENACSGETAVVLGGRQNTADSSWEIAP